MGNSRKIHIALSIVITAIFLCIGAFLCTRSYIRLWETITELGSSIKFYFCEIFEMENNTKVEVIEPSDIIAAIESNLDAVLVLTGVTSRNEIEKFPYRPKYVYEGVYELINELKHN